jgi:ubiquinone/menaquinone biosynthesis C-methylase UbiE
VDKSQAVFRAAALDALDRLAALPGIRRVRQVAREALAVGPGRRILDAGCGLGEEARELARLVGPDGEVTAIDLSTAFISAAAERDNGSGVHYAVGDIAKLEFPDEFFDGVRCERVIQHLADPDAVIAELARVVRPGGRVCLVDTDWESFLLDGMPEDLVGEMLAVRRGLGMLKPVGRQLRRRMVTAGLKDIAAEPITIAITDRPTAETIHPAFSAKTVRVPGLIEKRLANAWTTAFDAAIERGDFLCALTFWVVSGVKAG